MARAILAVSATNLTDLQANLDAAFASLPVNAIIYAVNVDVSNLARRLGGPEYKVSIDYDEAGGIALTDPWHCQIIHDKDFATAALATAAWINGNVGQFNAPVYQSITEPIRLTVVNLFLVVTNADLANAPSNWGLAGGGGGGVLYTNPAATPVTVGGIPAGSTFLNQTMQQMWDALLYPYQYPAFTAYAISGESTTQEVGDSIAAASTFTWSTSNSANVLANSIDLYDFTGSLSLATGLANDGSEAIVMPGPIQLILPGTYRFQIFGTNTLAGAFSRNLDFTWLWRKYWGNSANVTLTEAQIEALANNALSSSIPGTYSMAAGGYKYLCHALGGQINSVKDQATNFDVPFATVADDAAYSNVDGGGFSYALVAVTNTHGITTNYRVYRTRNSLGSAINLVVT
jgi:hypothetical protein